MIPTVETMCPEACPLTSFPSTHQALPPNIACDVTPTMAVETRLAKLGLNHDSFSTALVKQMTNLQISHKEQFGKLKGRIQGLITTQGTLQQQLTTVQTQAESDLVQRDEKLKALERENKQLQDQMAILIAQQTEKSKRLQKQLDDVRKSIPRTLNENKTNWDYHEQNYKSQIQSLQTQLSALQPKYHAAEKEKIDLIKAKSVLENRVIKLRTQQESLQRAAYEEPTRQKAAIKAKIEKTKQDVLNEFDKDIGFYSIHTSIVKARLRGSIPECDLGISRVAHITAPDGTSINPLTATWATERARKMAITYITE